MYQWTWARPTLHGVLSYFCALAYNRKTHILVHAGAMHTGGHKEQTTDLVRPHMLVRRLRDLMQPTSRRGVQLTFPVPWRYTCETPSDGPSKRTTPSNIRTGFYCTDSNHLSWASNRRVHRAYDMHLVKLVQTSKCIDAKKRIKSIEMFDLGQNLQPL